MNGLEVNVQIPFGAYSIQAAFHAPERGITSLFGPSGAGKTTVLRSIAGLIRNAQGRIAFNGQSWLDSVNRVAVPPHQRAVGYVFQEASLFPHLSVEGNLRYGYRRVPEHARRIAYDDAVQWLGVRPLLSRRPSELSGGERQRVAVARALLSSPRLLLMDEPLANLDEASRAEILPYFVRLHEELAIPVIYVTHSVAEVARLADTIVRMEQGAVAETGPASDLLQHLALAPGIHGPRASIFHVNVQSFDAHYRLCEVATPFGPLWVSAHNRLPSHARIQINASDVSIALQPETQSSILNQLPAKVEAIHEAGPGQILVRLIPREDAPGAALLALITTKSRDHLNLTPQTNVYARVKGVKVIA